MQQLPFPIDALLGRLYITCGQTNERYCLPTGVEVDYDDMMHYHLTENGFRQIIFFRHDGCYFLDEFSHQSAMAQQGTGARYPLMHSTGISLRRNRSAAAAAGASSWLYPDLAQLSQMMAFVIRLMGQSRNKTAVVFVDLHILSLRNITTQLRQDFDAYITGGLGSLPTDNQNVIIFNIPAIPHEPLRTLELSRLLYNESGRPLARVVCLGPPEQDEIANWLFSRYLKKQLEINWRDWRPAIVLLTSYVKREAQGLNILGKIVAAKTLSLETVRTVLDVESVNAPETMLNEMVGMAKVKEYLQKKRRSFPKAASNGDISGRSIMRLCPVIPDNCLKYINLHLILKGNPGTGKTTVCRIFGAFYREAGVLPLGHVVKVARQDLVSEYMGQTAIKTRAAINRAVGGVLFIDDAYSLLNGENDLYGREAIDTIVEAMTDLTGQLAVIMAGYPDDIERLLKVNSGLKHRFGEIITIDDYKPEEMKKIMLSFFSKHPQAKPLHEDLVNSLDRFCAALYGNRDKDYANARTLEKIALVMIENAVVAGDSHINTWHIPEKYQNMITKHTVTEDGIVENLDALIGLFGVKRAIKTLMSRINVARRRAKLDGDTARVTPGHFIFAGNPGTGKTTVARILAQQFFEMEIVQSPQIHEISAAKLIGRYVGGTGQKTQEFLEKGLNKVIFIDEAHQLRATGGEGADFRRDAIEVLVPFAENHRHDCVIILAGYEEQIREMIGGDAGLTSRFPNMIRFEDYNPDEMLEIFDTYATQEKMAWDRSWADLLKTKFASLRQQEGDAFANARSVRNYFSACQARHAVRVDGDTDDSALYRFSIEDLGFSEERSH